MNPKSTWGWINLLIAPRRFHFVHLPSQSFWELISFKQVWQTCARGEHDCNQGLLLSVLGISLGTLALFFFCVESADRGMLYGFAVFKSVPFFWVTLNINITFIWRLQTCWYRWWNNWDDPPTDALHLFFTDVAAQHWTQQQKAYGSVLKHVELEQGAEVFEHVELAVFAGLSVQPFRIHGTGISTQSFTMKPNYSCM